VVRKWYPALLGGLEVSLMGLPEHVDFGVTVPPGIDLMVGFTS
jgi:hypothetical protein